MKRFHIGYYQDLDRIFISGKTYHATTIDQAIEMFIKDEATPDKSLIKYAVEMDEFKN